MSEMHDDLGQLVADRVADRTDPVVILQTGRTIRAEIEQADPLTLPTDLGEDLREAAWLHVNADADIAALANQCNNQVSFTLYGVPVTMYVLKRINNPASPMADFLCGNKTNQDS